MSLLRKQNAHKFFPCLFEDLELFELSKGSAKITLISALMTFLRLHRMSTVVKPQ